MWSAGSIVRVGWLPTLCALVLWATPGLAQTPAPEEEGFGNNLSVPVVFSEGHGLTGVPTSEDTGLRPRPGEQPAPYWSPNPADSYILEDTTYYLQATASTWQADWRAGAPEGEHVIVNWSDNLIAQRWSPSSIIRVETVLYQQPTESMTAYTMRSLYGTEADEVFGTDTTTYESNYNTVFSVVPRLVIEKIDAPNGSVIPGAPRFEGSIAEGFSAEGPGGYSAEINGAGTVIYGYNWMLAQWPGTDVEKEGWWRISFILDPLVNYTIPTETADSYAVTRNVVMDASDPGDSGAEVLYKPHLVDPYTSILEIQIGPRGGRPPAPLVVTRAGTGKGRATSSPAGIDCGSDCWEEYARGTTVTLTATPEAGSLFGSWGGDADCEDGSVTMDGGRYCTATFDAMPITNIGPDVLPPGTAGVAYSQAFTATGGTGVYTFGVTGQLPAGLTFDPVGTLTGVPTVTGSFPLTVTATDTNTSAFSRDYLLVIGCGIITVLPADLPTATAGVSYPATSFSQTGGIPPAAFAYTGALPTGMSVASGTLSGTPTQIGSYLGLATATDANLCTGSRAYTLLVQCPTIAILPASLPAATVNAAFSQTFTQTGGVGTVVFSMNGALPPGLAFANGTLSGTPTALGQYPITITVTDENGCARTSSYVVVVNPVVCPTINVSPASLPAGTAGTPYPNTLFTQAGGVAPVTLSLTGTLPTGLGFAADTLSGTPMQTGSFPINVVASDRNSCLGSQSYGLEVGCPNITVNPTTISGATVASPYSQTFTSTGGVGAVTLTATGTLPPGLTFANGTLSGTPTTPGSYGVVVTATDAVGCSASRTYTAVVSAAPPTVTITTPVATPTFNATTSFLALGGTADDEAGLVSVRWANDRGGSGTAIGTTQWQARVPLQAGANIVTVTATDIDGLSATDVLTVTVDMLMYYLAEGATGAFFDYDLVIANPNLEPAPLTMTFMREDGSTVAQQETIPARTHRVFRVDEIPGLTARPVSVAVCSTTAKPVVIERTMLWVGVDEAATAADPIEPGASYYAGHTAIAVDAPDEHWYFAEGAQGFFDTFLLIANPNATPADAAVTFLREGEPPVVANYALAANSRLTIFTGAFADLQGRAFGIQVVGTKPLIAERAMYFTSDQYWKGGHESHGATELDPQWYFAEGAAGSFFDTYILVGNPNTAPANLTVTHLFDSGATIVKPYTLRPQSRLTIDVEREHGLTESAAFSTTVVADRPIVAERAMYWSSPFPAWVEAHNSHGANTAAMRWGIAEGRVGGSLQFETYILLANTSATTANVRITYLREDGGTITRTYTVPPTTRVNVHVNAQVPELADRAFGALIESTNGVPIVVESSLYWSAPGTFWIGGTNSEAIPLP